MLRSGFALLTLISFLAACESDRRGDPALAQACAFKTCECIKDGSFLGSGNVGPPLWRENGDAYCPEGFSLRLTGDNKPYERRKPSKDDKGGIGIEIPMPSF